ncbi:uncharacterized protein LOC142995031 [Genypterus blacodes]|uniref:uncharacterized protein LOC142995031 n=1 Tax=Genypterus blacodes TaxID=154954 RepID=UPI003F76C97D
MRSSRARKMMMMMMLGFVLNVAHCMGILDTAEERYIEITRNLTATLGEDVHLSCRFLHDRNITASVWKRKNKKTAKRLTGFTSGKAFRTDAKFSLPESPTNLTVKVKVSSVAMEGTYTCEFLVDEEEYVDSMFLTVQVRPDVHILVTEETIGGVHYQSVSCSAVGGRPAPQIGWLVDNLPPSDDPFTVETSDAQHPNGTATVSSTLRFPTHLQDEESVTCTVQHPTLPDPELTTVGVKTYIAPNVSVKAEMVQREGSEFWVVSCVASGGRPDTDISLASDADEELQREDDYGSDAHTHSFYLPASVYEGHNITCVFHHPKLTHGESRVITLPSFYLSEFHVFVSVMGNSSQSVEFSESLELQEGQSGAVFDLEVSGNVPHYAVSCQKDGGPLPKGVQVLASRLTLHGPVEFQHAGLYECVASYHRHRATLQFNITVTPHVILPVPPTVRVDLRSADGHSLIECSADDAVPVANMSWLLPEGVSGASWFNFTSHNGSHSVRGLLLLPACSPWEFTAECLINHPAFEKPENRSITLPLCARPIITVNSSVEWRGGEQFTAVDCFVDSVAPAATITWQLGIADSDDPISQQAEAGVTSEVQADGLVTSRSSVKFMSSLYAGQNLTCVVEHPSLETPEERTTYVPVPRAPELSVSVVRQRDSPLWLAVCDLSGEGVVTDLKWVLPQHTRGQTSRLSESDGRVLKSRLTYRFPLSLHEGQNLTCVSCDGGEITQKKTIHIPRYYISSVRVLNHTAPPLRRHGGQCAMHRVALRDSDRRQRILLSVNGNTPEYNLTCQRRDGSLVPMEGSALVFQSEPTEQDEGLYTCKASFYHHQATVNIQVEVESKDKHLEMLSVIAVSSASAITIVLIVTLWVFCKRSNRSERKESLSALTGLMQEPGSPVVTQPAVQGRSSEEYAQLISYSIVLDVKSTV